MKEDKDKSVFKDSKVLDIKNLSLIADNITLSGMMEEITDNLEFYYSNAVEDWMKVMKFEEALKNYNFDYNQVIYNSFNAIKNHYTKKKTDR